MIYNTYIDVKLDDGTYKPVKTTDIEQIFLDKITGDITIWWNENGKIMCAPAAYWERSVK